MEFRFNPHLPYQLSAIDAVTDLFDEQPNTHQDVQFTTEDGVIPNALQLTEEALFANLQTVQSGNDVDTTSELKSLDFSIEMETGTGKTYTYLRTVHELFKFYGWKKFIVVVPSIAIKEGVLKTLRQTQSHFENICGNTASFFEYDSDNLHRVKRFGNSNDIEVMVMTLQSINRDENVAYRQYDSLQGQRPIDIIKQTNPILILDEPQNMETENSREALDSLAPLFTLRYSATHRKTYNLLYQLTPVDAYEKGLVKQIDVLSVTKDKDFNTTYIKVLDIEADSRGPKAKLELHKDLKNGIKPGKKTVRYGDDLYAASKGVSTYEGITVTQIDAAKGYVEFSDGTRLEAEESTDVDFQTVQHHQIRETVREHFDKALNLHQQGIKVLSLFFIDEVANYTDEDGHLRQAFTGVFNELKTDPKYEALYGDKEASEVTGSYFSEYKSESYIESDDEAYDLIMRDKEQLLSLDEPVEFVFSHSALKEGWDNPNVFQICTLNETVSRIKKRQEIGRGVRLAVNQDGERVHNDEVNVLTVIANESYASYVSALQTEYEEETGFDDEVTERVKDRRKRTTVEPDEETIESEEFSELWELISPRTRYVATIDTEQLIKEAVPELEDISVQEPNINLTKSRLALNEEDESDGVEVMATSQSGESRKFDREVVVPDIVSDLAEATNLTKRTIATMLLELESLEVVAENPQEFVTKARNVLTRVKTQHVVENVQYEHTDDAYGTEILSAVQTYEDKTVEVEKSVYDRIIYDSEGECEYAKRLNRDDEVLVFVKLPSNYTIPTPEGEYNPDWAIVHQEKGVDGEPVEGAAHVYLVKETKFVEEGGLREYEDHKTSCAEKHYEVLGIDYDVVRDVDSELVRPE